jgi:hypothetical protein
MGHLSERQKGLLGEERKPDLPKKEPTKSSQLIGGNETKYLLLTRVVSQNHNFVHKNRIEIINNKINLLKEILND